MVANRTIFLPNNPAFKFWGRTCKTIFMLIFNFKFSEFTGGTVLVPILSISWAQCLVLIWNIRNKALIYSKFIESVHRI